jgi:hypothetical protein
MRQSGSRARMDALRDRLDRLQGSFVEAEAALRRPETVRWE